MMIARPLPSRPTRREKRRILLPVAIALALFTSGCDKCGDYFWQGGSKSCHDESQVK